MSFLLSLVPILGKPVAEKLLGALSKKAKGAERLKEATDLMQKGATAIEALKQAFGNDFLKSLNEIKNGSGGYKFTYEAGTSDYIKIPEQDEAAKYQLLRDELNIRSGSANLNSAISANSGHHAGPTKDWRTGVTDGQEISTAHTPYPQPRLQGPRRACGLPDCSSQAARRLDNPAWPSPAR